MTYERRILDPAERLVLNEFTRLAPISEDDRTYIANLLQRKRRHEAGHELISSGERLEAPIALLRGWVCLANLMPDGRRQILDFYLPGNIVGYCSRPQSRAKAAYLALTPVEIALTTSLHDLKRGGPFDRVIDALDAGEEESERRLCNQITRNGRQSALESVASLILELYDRLEQSGQAIGRDFTIPLTQEMLADSLGLSVVHVNRTLQDLKRRQLIAGNGAHIEITDVAQLTALAEGKPTRIEEPSTLNGHPCGEAT